MNIFFINESPLCIVLSLMWMTPQSSQGVAKIRKKNLPFGLYEAQGVRGDHEIAVSDICRRWIFTNSKLVGIVNAIKSKVPFVMLCV